MGMRREERPNQRPSHTDVVQRSGFGPRAATMGPPSEALQSLTNGAFFGRRSFPS